MTYSIRAALTSDIHDLVTHREGMFRDMGVECNYPAMAVAYARWLQEAVPVGTYRGWVAEADGGSVVASGGLTVMAWAPGPWALDPRCPFIVNVYTHPAHRKRGLARQLMETMHAWCRAEGIERVALNASTEGLPIYQSMGYVLAPEPMMRLRL